MPVVYEPKPPHVCTLPGQGFGTLLKRVRPGTIWLCEDCGQLWRYAPQRWRREYGWCRISRARAERIAGRVLPHERRSPPKHGVEALDSPPPRTVQQVQQDPPLASGDPHDFDN